MAQSYMRINKEFLLRSGMWNNATEARFVHIVSRSDDKMLKFLIIFSAEGEVLQMKVLGQ